MSLTGSLIPDNEITIAGTIHYFARQFGVELGEQVNSHLIENASPSWFATLKADRRAAGLPTYDDFKDSRFLLKEALDTDGIVHFGVQGFDNEWRIIATPLRRKLNAWFHGSLEPSLSTFLQLTEGLRFLAERSGLPVYKQLVASVNKARQIEAGSFKEAIAETLPTPTPSDAEFAAKLAEKQAEIVKRPPVGAEWLGSKGTRKIVISKIMNDVTENGASIRAKLGSNPQEVIDSWLRYYPNGGEAKVADDGAVMGFRLGQAYLIGWLSQDPILSQAPNQNQSTVLGFALPYEYIFTHNDVRELSSGKLLSVDAVEDPKRVIEALGVALEEGEFFSATAYGELISQAEFEENKLITTVHKNIWFKGHLPG